MPSRRLSWAVALVVLLLPRPARADEPTLAQRLQAVLGRPAYQHARWGVLVVDPATGKTVYEHNADQLFAPASVTKLYSCAAALIALGADYRFETPVYRRGKLDGGRLTGDLILVASGDLTMGGRTGKDGRMAFVNGDHTYAGPTSTTHGVTDTDPLAGLKELARQVKAAGVQQVTGDVLVDDRLFDRARGSGSGPDIVTPIVVNDNVVDVLIRPTKPGAPATYELRPKTEFAQVDVRVDTVARGEKANVTTRRVGPQRWVLRGQVPADAKPVVRVCMVDDPAGFARALFIEALRAEGVDVPASVLRAPTAELPERESYARLERAALYRSPPLSEALKVTLKVSHNLYASTLPLLLAVKAGKRTQREGMREQGRLLGRLGVDVKGISLESGAGGGNGDRVSPRATVQLLTLLLKRKDWPTYEAALPILGVDGTLSTAVGKDSPAKGKVFGKTGTYTDANALRGTQHLRAKSLAGVMTTAKGTALTYAIFVNDVLLPPGVTGQREGRVIGELCEILYRHGP